MCPLPNFDLSRSLLLRTLHCRALHWQERTCEAICDTLTVEGFRKSLGKVLHRDDFNYHPILPLLSDPHLLRAVVLVVVVWWGGRVVKLH